MSTAKLKPQLQADAVSKSRVITANLVDIAVDLLLPTAVYLLLAPTHLAVAIRLTMGGFLVAGKAAAGRTRPACQPGPLRASRRRRCGSLCGDGPRVVCRCQHHSVHRGRNRGHRGLHGSAAAR